MDMEIKKDLMVENIMDRCGVDSDTAEMLFDCEVEAYAEKNKIEDLEAAEHVSVRRFERRGRSAREEKSLQ